MSRLVFGQENAVGRYLRQYFPELPKGYLPRLAVAWVEGDELTGAAAIDFPYPWEGVLIFHGEKGFRPLPGQFRDLAEVLFGRLKLKRLTALIAKKDKRARRAVERIGFELEGVKRLGIGGMLDETIYGMTFDRCRWLKDDRHAEKRAA